MLNVLARDSLTYAIPSVVSKGLPLIIALVFTRVLSPTEFGTLDLIVVFVTLANLTVALEVSQGVARHYVAEPDATKRNNIAATAFWFTFACYALFAMVTLPFAQAVASLLLGERDLAPTMRLGIALACSNGLLTTTQNQLRWDFRSRAYSTSTVLSATTMVVLASWLTFGLGLGVDGVLIGMTIGSVAGVLYGLRASPSLLRPILDTSRLRAMLAFSTPLVPSGIALLLSTYSDRVMIRHFMSVADVGLYAVAFRSASVVLILTVGIQLALTPLIYAHSDDPNAPAQLARIFRTFLGAALTVTGVMFVAAEAIVGVFASEVYLGAASLIVYVVPAIFLTRMTVFAPGINLSKKTAWILAIHGIGAITNIGLNFVMIPAFGLTGAAMATLISSGTTFSIMMSVSQRYFPVPHEWMRGARACAAVAVAIVANQMLSGVSEVALAIDGLTLLVVLFAVFGFGLIREADVRAAKAWVLRSPRGHK